MKLILVRHGETDWNSKGIVHGGDTDIPLNKIGLKQAQKTALRLKDEPITVLYSSPMKRAVETAEVLNQYHNLDVHITPILRERHFGKLEGTPYVDLEKTMIDVKKHDRFDELEIERLETFEKRLETFIEELYKQHQQETILAVCHSSISKMILAVVQEIPYQDLRAKIVKPNASVSTIHFDEERKIVELEFGDTSHLQENS